MEKSGCVDGFVAFAFDQLEDRRSLSAKCSIFSPFAREFVDELLDGVRFVQFDQARAAAACLHLALRSLSPAPSRLRFAVTSEFPRLATRPRRDSDRGSPRGRPALRPRPGSRSPTRRCLRALHHDKREARRSSDRAREVFLEVAAVPPDRVAELREPLQKFEHVLKLRSREDLAVGQILQLHLLRAERDQDLVELRVIIHVLLALLALDQVERRQAM